MNKILVSIFCASLFLGCSLNAIGSDIPELQDSEQIKSSNDLIEKFIEITENENTSLRLTTAGPRNFLYFKMKIDNGSIIDRYALYETLIINIAVRAFFLIWTPLKLLRPVMYIISEQGKTDFTIEYKRDIPEGNSSRYKYWTQYGKYENNSFTNESINIYNEKHKLEVKGFYGAILITKRCLFLHPLIAMTGNYDKITLIE